MRQVKHIPRLIALTVFGAALVPLLGCPGQGLGQYTLIGRVQELEEQVAALEAKLAHVSVEEDSINGVNGPHLIIEGCNVHVRSGGAATDDAGELTGLGNLIIGYNNIRIPFDENSRLGSHNMVVGDGHEYPSYGGLVAGLLNSISGPNCSVTGGNNSEASGERSSISGGFDNSATGTNSSVSGGQNNIASGELSSVAGGLVNTASGQYATVSGGAGGSAPNVSDWVAGSLFEDD